MKNKGMCIASLVGGMIIGSALTLLLTPQSGPELRHALREKMDKEFDKISQEIDAARCQCDQKPEEA
ncbi:MAG: YtxH domain-containing protein [Alistipes sp.]